MLQSQSAVESSEILQSPGVIQSLERVRERVKEQLIKVPEFRALLAIETSIAEVSNIPDLAVSLEAAKQKIMDRLMTVREYQAMLAVEKAIVEISDVLGVLAVGENSSAAPAAAPKKSAFAPNALPEDPEFVSPIDAEADRLAKMLGLTDEPFVNRLS
jgi:hypothetical protein